MADYLLSVFLVAPAAILLLVLLMPSDQELAVASIERERERVAIQVSSKRRLNQSLHTHRFFKGWFAACVTWTALVAGATYLSWPEQTRSMPVLPELPSLEHYEQAYSRSLTEESFFEFHAAAVRRQNTILATHQEFEDGYGDRIKRLLLVVLALWIGPCAALGVTMACVEGRR
ncbi:hypothetical protein HKW97_23335 (plasmid) [Pseudomonas luteola]|uniref:hypothetical protein n=1 Tax=Pseudomonas luteola TaxID=47886 RepID=UPI00388F8CE9